jgi:hypothetical protein
MGLEESITRTIEMKPTKIVNLIQHIVTTFLIAFLTNMQLDSAITWKAACLGAAVITLRDVKSLFDPTPNMKTDEVPNDSVVPKKSGE